MSLPLSYFPGSSADRAFITQLQPSHRSSWDRKTQLRVELPLTSLLVRSISQEQGRMRLPSGAQCL